MRWCWVNFQCWGVLLIWISIGQGPTALAVGAGGGGLDFFLSSIIFFFSVSLSPGDGLIKTESEILSQMAVNSKPTIATMHGSTVWSDAIYAHQLR